jgi:hypothetical protein
MTPEVTSAAPDPSGRSFPGLSLSRRRGALVILTQNWENARHIKNERLSFTNMFSLVAAGTLSVLHGVQNEKSVAVLLLVFLLVFSLIGLLTSLRLKAELEDCLHRIDHTASALDLTEFMALSERPGVPTRYPKFRWLYPVYYSVATLGFVTMLLVRIFHD